MKKLLVSIGLAIAGLAGWFLLDHAAAGATTFGESECFSTYTQDMGWFEDAGGAFHLLCKLNPASSNYHVEVWADHFPTGGGVVFSVFYDSIPPNMYLGEAFGGNQWTHAPGGIRYHPSTSLVYQGGSALNFRNWPYDGAWIYDGHWQDGFGFFWHETERAGYEVRELWYPDYNSIATENTSYVNSGIYMVNNDSYECNTSYDPWDCEYHDYNAVFRNIWG